MNRFAFTVSLLLLFIAQFSFAQTSWKGTSSTSWTRASNWTNGVPTSTTDAIIGDANFTGSHQPSIGSNVACKSLSIGNGTKVCNLTVTRALDISGSLTIGAHGTLTHQGHNITLSGNWNNSGAYTYTANNSFVTFSGTVQSINGATTFRNLTINAGGRTSLNANITVTSQLTVNGTLDPNESPAFSVLGTGKLSVTNGATLLVKASTFAGNYALSGAISFNGSSVIDYSSASVNQTIANSFTYGTVRISGGTTKTLSGDLPPIKGNLNVAAGILDLATFTANSVSGGSVIVAAGATLRIGGTNTFPSNFGSVSLAGLSTVEYSGTNQAVSNQLYGNLTLKGSAGAVSKTMPVSAMTIAGNFASSVGTAVSVSFTAGAAITVKGNITLGSSTTFTGGSFTHTIAGNWTNDGSFAGGAGTVSFSGSNKSISGAGTNNFNNVVVSGAGLSVSSGTNLTIAGNLSTTGAGSFTHLPGGAGTATMSGSGKTISGSAIIFNHLTVSGSVSTGVSLTVAGNLAVSGTLNGTAGTMTLSGASNAVSGAGTLSFYALNITGNITTARSFSVKSNLSVGGALTGTAGTVTFSGSSTLSGTVNFFNVILNGTKLQLGSGSVLGVAGALTVTAGNLDVITTIPNTVDFNSSGSQTITTATYHNLKMSTGGLKTAVGGLTINGNIFINPGATFNAGNLTHILYGNWTNNGTFIASASTVQFVGPRDASITGNTTFNLLTLNKDASTNLLVLNNDVTVSTVAMTRGTMHTGSQSLTMTASRTGSGIILGSITRTHTFSDATSYAFEGPDNTINFANGASGVTSVTVAVTSGIVNSFPFDASINRQYAISVSTGSPYLATLRLHYEDAELNGNTESTMQQWNFNGVAWTTSGNTGLDTVNNWLEQSGLASIDGGWTLADLPNVALWTGSVSSSWEDGANWTSIYGAPSLPPATTDIALLGSTTFNNQPSITSSVLVKSITFESEQATTLSIGAGGALTTKGNIRGFWTGNSSHVLDVNSQALTVGGDLNLSDGVSGHSINLMLSSGDVTVIGSLIQSGDASISWGGAGTMRLGGDFNYSGGTFTAGAGTMSYNGTGSQVVGGVPYNVLSLSKPSGTATLPDTATVAADLQISTGGVFLLNAPVTVTGNVTINLGALLDGGSSAISLGGNWNNSGSFEPNAGTVAFSGSNQQAISSSPFNNLIVNKPGASAALGGSILINGDLTVSNGTLDVNSFAANRSTVGGILTLSSGSVMKIGGAGNFPSNFEANTLDVSSTTEYDGAQPQAIAPVTYGNLTLSLGGANNKFLSGSTTIGGDFLLNGGASFSAGSSALTVAGNWTNMGTFIDSSSIVTLSGASKTLTGATTFYDLVVSGSITAAGDVTIDGLLSISGSFQAGGSTTTIDGGLSNSGVFLSSGVVTFAGSTLQTLGLNSGFASSGSVNFNGTISPSFVDLTVPVLNDVYVNNTAGISPNIGWSVGGKFVVASGASFSGGTLTHTFGGDFTNNGSVNSSGTIAFNPSSAVDVQFLGTSFSSSGTVNFGGTGGINVSGGSPAFTTVNITNTGAGGVTPNSNWTVLGDVFIQSGSMLNGGAGLTHTFSGNFTNNGTFNGASSTAILNNPVGSALQGNGTTAFNNLTIAGTVTALSGFSVLGNFADNGTFDATGVTANFTGNGPSIISGTSVPVPFDQLTVAKNSATTSLSVNLSGLTSLTVSGGTLDLSTFTITQNGAGGTLALLSGSLLRIGGANTLPAFDTTSFDPASSVEYNGTGSQSILAAPVYGGIILSNSGTKTAQAALTLQGDFTLLGGTFVGGPFTHSVAGNWTMSGGTFTNTGTTIALNGAGAQLLSTSGSFNNLSVNKSSGTCIATSDVTVGGILAFLNGTISTGSNTIIINPAGNVFRVSGHVVGNLRKSIAAGPSTRTFEVGDLISYSPVDLQFANVTTPGTVTVSATAAEHPDVANSLIDSRKDVNRYWSVTNGATAFTTCDATFNFVPGDVDAGADPNTFIVQKFDSPVWSSASVGTRSATSIQAAGLSSFSDFILGELEIDTIVASATGHGAILPSGTIVLPSWSDTSFTITPDLHNHVDSLLVDGIPVSAVPVYAFTHLTANHTIEVRFATDSYPITASAGPGGLIAPSGTVLVNYGDSRQFSITPDVGYQLDSLLVDGVRQDSNVSYTFSNVTSAHSIHASFVLSQYTITASAGTGGAISPAGPVSVNYGDSLRFTITPDSGFYIADVHVDTSSVGPVPQYTFADVRENHSISAIFRVSPNPPPQLFLMNPLSGFRGQSLDIDCIGRNFIDGVSSVPLLSNIGKGTVTILSDSTLRMHIVIQANASPGPRLVYVHNGPPGGGNSDTLTFTVLNNMPTAFGLALPADHDTVLLKGDVFLPVTFSWHPSTDPDIQDTLKYSLSITGSGIDTTLTGLTDTSAGVQLGLQDGVTYRWMVSVYDGFSTVASADTFSFTAHLVTGVADQSLRIPKEYALHQNFPNPFNPATMIQVDLPHESMVTLRVYNLLGQEVLTLIDGTSMSAGIHAIQFNASSIPSGVYLYRLTADGAGGKSFVSVKKLILLR